MGSKTSSVIRFIHKSRRAKKKLLYRMALGVAIDKTIAVYLSFFIGIGFFVIYDELKKYKQWFDLVEDNAVYVLSILAIIYSLRALSLTSASPGMYITSAEYKLMTLPFKKEDVWFAIFVRTICKTFLVQGVVFVLVTLFTPFTTTFMLQFFVFSVIISVLLLLPQWYLYSLSIWTKVKVYFSFLFSFGLVRFLFFMLEIEDLFSFLFIVVLAILNIVLWKKRVKKVDWKKVIDESDRKIWNMFFINKISKVEIKPARKSLMRQVIPQSYKKKPFDYKNKTVIFRRLWIKELAKHKEASWNTLTCIVLCLGVLSYQTVWLQALSVIIAIFLVNQFIVSYFRAGFSEKLLHSIPWSMTNIVKAYLTCITPFLFLLLIVYVVLLMIHHVSLMMIILQVILVSIATICIVQTNVAVQVKIMNHKWYKSSVLEQIISPMTYIIIFFVVYQPLLYVYIVILIVYWLYLSRTL